MRFLIGLFICMIVPAMESASAHSVLLSTTPAAEATLDVAPGAVELTFNEPVQPIAIRALDRTGAAITKPDDVTALGSTIFLTLPQGLARGSYVVTWRIVSSDSHPVGGSFRFYVGAADGSTVTDAAAAREGIWEAASILNRAIFYAALLSAAGGVLFLLLIDSSGARRVAWIAALALIPTILSLPIEGGRLLAAPPESLLGFELWRMALDSTFGPSILLAGSGLALIFAGLNLNIRLLFVLGALTAIGSLTLTGHAATASPRPMMGLAIFIHALAVSFWFGSLWPLLVSVRTLEPRRAADVLHRFSDLALATVVLLMAAGATIALVQAPTTESLVTTEYGRIFLFKLFLVGVLLLLAFVNRHDLTPRLAKEEPAARDALMRNIRIEIAVIFCVLSATAVLGHVTPPRALADAAEHGSGTTHAHGHSPPVHAHHDDGPIALTVSSGRYFAEIRLDSAKAGRTAIEATIRDATGRALEPLEVKAQIASPERGIEPFTRALTRRDQTYRLETTDLAFPGRWTIRLDALVTDFEKTMFETEVTVR